MFDVFSLQGPSEDAKHASHCSHSTPSGAVCACVREIRWFSHDLNLGTGKGRAHPSPPDPLSQRGASTKRTLFRRTDREKHSCRTTNRYHHMLQHKCRTMTTTHTLQRCQTQTNIEVALKVWSHNMRSSLQTKRRVSMLKFSNITMSVCVSWDCIANVTSMIMFSMVGKLFRET